MNELLAKAVSLIERGSNPNVSIDELEDIRIQLSAIRFYLAEEYLITYAQKRDAAEMDMDAEESHQFGTLYNSYIDKYLTPEGKKRYTKSSCESLARRTYKLEGSKFYKKKEYYLEMKREVDRIYQVIKAIENFSHAISSKIRV